MKKRIEHTMFSCLLMIVFLHLGAINVSADSNYQLKLDGTWMNSAQLPNTYRKQTVSHNYSFTLTQDSLVTFTSKRGTLENASYDLEKNGTSYISGYLYDEYSDSDELDNSITVALNVGTYTLKIHTERYFEYSGSYQVKALATALNTNEAEPNGDSAIAMGLTSNQSIKGVLSMIDDKDDWYTFTIPSASKVTASVSVLQGALTFEVYGSDLQKVHDDVFWYYNDAFTVSPSTKTVTYELEPGKYYIRCYTWDKGGFDKKKKTQGLQSMAVYTVQWNRKVPVTGITVSGADSIKVGNSTTFSAYILPTDASNKSVRWSSSNQDVAVVDSNGKVTGIGVGEAVIFAMASDGSGITESREITVTAAIVQNDTKPANPADPTDSIGTFSAPDLTNKAGGINVKWKEIRDAAGYYIYRSKNKGAFKKIKTISSENMLSYTDTAATTNGAKYRYKIIPYGTTGISGKESPTSVIYRLAKPTILSAVNTSSKKITVKWRKNAKATGYQIKYVANFSTKTTTIKNNFTTKRILSGLKKNKMYRISIRTYKSVSGKKYYSTWSATKNVKVSKK